MLGAGAVLAAGTIAGCASTRTPTPPTASTGVGATSKAIKVGIKRWTFGVSDETFTPLLATSGALYVGSSDHFVYALDVTSGAQRWRYAMAPTTSSAPALDDGLLCIGSDDGHLYALDAATGVLRWSYNAGSAIVGAPVLGNGLVTACSSDSVLHAVRSVDGAPQWTSTAFSHVRLCPMVAGDSLLISDDMNITALNASTGIQQWVYPTGFTQSSPAAANGLIYVSTQDGYLYAVDGATAKQLWLAFIGGPGPSSPAVSQGIVYCGGASGNISALDARTGAQRWSFQTDDNDACSPVVADGVVSFASFDNFVYALNAATGAALWRYPLDVALNSSFEPEQPGLTDTAMTNDIVCALSRDGYIVGLSAGA